MSFTVRFFAFSLFFGSFCHLYAADSGIEDLLNKAAAVPSAIKSGDWILKTRYEKFDIPSNNPDARKLSGLTSSGRTYGGVFHIEFDGDKMRVQRDVEGRTTVYCTPYLKPEHSFFFATRPLSMRPISERVKELNLPEPVLESLILYQKKDFDRLSTTEGYSQDTSIPCLQRLGYVADDVFFEQQSCASLAVYLQSFGFAKGAILQDTYKGSPCTVIRKMSEGPVSFRGNVTVVDESGQTKRLTQQETSEFLKKKPALNRVQEEIVLDPSKNHAIRRIVREHSIVKIRQILENDLKRDPDSGCWYPAHWVFEEYRDGKLAVREENDLEVISINKRIPKSRFTLESVEMLKPGTRVTWKLDTPPPGKGKLEWDGKEVFAHGEFGENLITREVDAERAGKRRIAIICLNIALIAAIIASILYQKNRRASNES